MIAQEIVLWCLGIYRVEERANSASFTACTRWRSWCLVNMIPFLFANRIEGKDSDK